MKINISSALIRQYVIVTIVNFGALTTGMSLGWPSPVIVKLSNGTDTPLSRPITEVEGSWIVSGGYLVVTAIIFLSGILLDRLGRKYCFILVSVPKLFAATWTIFVTEVWMLIFCRVVMVLCECFILVVVPVYASEIACKEHRGSLGTFLNLFLSIGTVIVLSIGPFLSYVAINCFIAGFIAVTTLPVIFLPDSPFHLYNKGRINEAIKVLSTIRDSDVDIKKEIEDYELSRKESNIDKMALLKNKLFIKSLLLGLLLCVGSNLIGYLAISFYIQTILESAKTSLPSDLASAIIAGTQLIGAICSPFITKKNGRRPILYLSVFGMGCGMVGLGTYFMVVETDLYTISGFMNYLPLISLILIVLGYIIGIGNLMFVVTTELFDGPSRAIGLAICLTPSILLTFLTSKYFAQATSAIGPSLTYYFFGAMCLLITILILIFLPETKGKTFNEIQGLFIHLIVHLNTLKFTVCRLLLNKRNSPTLEHALAAITECIKLDTGCVRKVFTQSGTIVSALNQFFEEEDVFFAYGNERVNQEDYELEFEESKAVLQCRKIKYNPVTRNARQATAPN